MIGRRNLAPERGPNVWTRTAGAERDEQARLAPVGERDSGPAGEPDAVALESAASFPASDSPSWTPVRGVSPREASSVRPASRSRSRSNRPDRTTTGVAPRARRVSQRPEGRWPLVAAGVGLWAAARVLRARRAIGFEGRVVVISGGSRGLGLLIARRLSAEGARLALLARDPDELTRAADDIEARGRERPFIQQCDIAERLQAEQAIRDVAAHFGRLDVLINDAGVIEVGPVEHMTVHDFETSMGVHFWGPLYLTLAALPHLKKHRGARLVNISSIGGRVAVPHLVPYSAGKFALTGLSDGLRAELAKDGIRVTTVLPWLMRTGSPFNAWFKGQHRAEFAWFTIFDSLPGLTVDGERAARRIVDAVRHGDAELVTAVYARLAIVADAMFPSLMARSMDLMNRLLPAPGSGLGPEARSGWQSRSRWAPSALTRLTEKATAANNEVPR